MICNDFQAPLVTNKIDDSALMEITNRCSTMESCRISRNLWLYRSQERYNNLQSFDKTSNNYGSQSESFAYLENDFCRSFF